MSGNGSRRPTSVRSEADADDIDPEIFDDTDFFKQHRQEYLESTMSEAILPASMSHTLCTECETLLSAYVADIGAN